MKILRTLTLIVGMVLLPACTTLGNLVSPTGSALVSVAVDLAVGAAVAKGVSPTLIATTAQELLALDSGSSVAITAIDAALQAKLASLHLPPADLLAVNVLSTSIVAIINSKITAAGGAVKTATGTVTATTQVAIALVLNDVIAAAQAT